MVDGDLRNDQGKSRGSIYVGVGELKGLVCAQGASRSRSDCF